MTLVFIWPTVRVPCHSMEMNFFFLNDDVPRCIIWLSSSLTKISQLTTWRNNMVIALNGNAVAVVHGRGYPRLS